MARDDDIFEDCETTPTNKSDLNNSIVKKVSSLIPSSISKWFGKSQSRRRDSDSDDESFILEQPPAKRARMPTPQVQSDDQPQSSNSYMSSKLVNGSSRCTTTTTTKKTQVKTTELLNNIRPRQSFHLNRDYSKVTNTFPSSSYSSQVQNDEPVAGPSGLQKHHFATPSTVFSKRTMTPDKMNGEKKTDSGGSTSGCSSMAQKNVRQSVSPVAGDDTISSPKGIVSINTEQQSDKIELSPVGSDAIHRSPSETAKRFSYMQNNSKQSPSTPAQSPRTLFADHTFTPQNANKSLASRRPSFNPAAFGTTTLQDNTLTSERLASSPFYAGRTMFGGAASSRNLLPQNKATLRNLIQVKPSNDKDMKTMQNSVSMSQTARRIMDVLENFNSPVEDARRIPRLNFSSRLDSRDQARTSTLYQRTPYSRDNLKKLNPQRTPPIKGLTVPTISEVIELKRKLQSAPTPPKTANIFAQSTSILTPTSTTQTISKPIERVTKPIERFTKPKDPEPKIRERKRENLKTQQHQFSETVPQIELPNIPLPITNLPKFELAPLIALQKKPEVSILPTVSKPEFTSSLASTPALKMDEIKFNAIPVSKPLWEQSKKTGIKVKDTGYHFASPIPIEISTVSSKNLMSINNFKFSKPVIIKEGEKMSGDKEVFNFKCPSSSPVLKQKSHNTSPAFPSPVASTPFKLPNSMGSPSFVKSMNFISPINKDWECTSCAAKNHQSNERCVACTTLKPGAKVIFSDLTQKKLSPVSWECKDCNTQNLENKCKSCNRLKPDPSNPSQSFGAQNDLAKFAKKANEWECSSCMVRNLNNRTTCLCCEAQRPSVNSTNLTKPSIATSSLGTWECGTCLIRNKNELSKCEACQANRQGDKSNSTTSNNHLTSIFAKKTNDWECPSCMIRNATTVLKCACCETPQPGTAAPTKIQTNTLGSGGIQLPKTTEFKFGIDKSDVKADAKTDKTPASTFTFGTSSVSKPTTSNTSTVSSSSSASTFTFGVPKSDAKTWECPTCMVKNKDDILKCVCCETAKPGSAPSLSTPAKAGIVLEPTTQFKFGIDKVDSPVTTINTPATTSTFTFGASTSTPPKTTAAAAPPVFSFGASSTTVAKESKPQTNNYNTGVDFGVARSSASNQYGSPKTVSSVTYSTSTTSTVNFGGGKTSMATFGSPINSNTTQLPIFSTSSEPKPVVFGSPTTTSNNIVFGSTPATTNASSALFGSTTVTTTTTTPLFGNLTPSMTFGTPNTKPFENSSFTFKSSSTTATSSTTALSTTITTPTTAFTFGSSDKPKTVEEPKKPMFSLDKPAAAPSWNASATAPFSFDAKSSEAPKPIFGANPFGSTFGATTQASTTTFGSPAQSSAFGAVTQASTTNFGAASSTTSFGAVTQSTTPTFGAAAQSTAPTFGAATQAAAPTFGATTQASASTFGSAAQGSATTFGAVATQASATNPSFGAAAPIFGTPASTWGQNNSTSTTAFQFGSTPSQPQQPQPMFSFGGSSQGQIGQSTTNAAPGGFSFASNNAQLQVPAQPSIPTFNPNTKPVFNFTSGAPAPTFTAQLSGGSLAGNPTRRIKKAVRRNPRAGP